MRRRDVLSALKLLAHGIVIALLALCAVLLVFDATQFGTFHDGRCGYQEWRRPFLWMDFTKRDYDAFGIPGRWEKAHAYECSRIWRRGALAPDVSGYWPRLHLMVASGAPITELEKAIAHASMKDVREDDALGRTLLHWAVIHPDVKHRDRLIALLLRKGLRMDAKNKEGLTPADWKWRSEKKR